MAKNLLRSAELHDADKAKSDAEMPVLAIHIHPIMALKERLPKLRALKLKGIKLPKP